MAVLFFPSSSSSFFLLEREDARGAGQASREKVLLFFRAVVRWRVRWGAAWTWTWLSKRSAFAYVPTHQYLFLLPPTGTNRAG